MVVESGLDAAPDVFLRAESAERNARYPLTLLHLADEFVAAAIRKADVADECIKMVLLQKLQRALHTINGGDLISAFGKQP